MIVMEPSTDRVASAVACPCCGSSCRKYQDRLDNTGRPVSMAICPACFAIINTTSLLEHSEDHQRIASEEFYQVDDSVKENAAQEAIWRRELLDFAYRQLPELEKVAYADVGAGLGFMAAAGALDFQRAYAVELNQSGIRQLLSHYARSDNLIVVDDISAIDDNLDLITLWHVIEHLPDVLGFLRQVIAKLSDVGAIYFQVPMFRPDYVFDTHYSFLSEESCEYLCGQLGLFMRGIWYDSRVDFMACIMSKQPGSKLDPESLNA